MISNRYICDGFGINISHSDDGIICIDTCGLGLLISFLQSLSNCVTVKTFHSPILGISHALIHPENPLITFSISCLVTTLKPKWIYWLIACDI